MRLSPPQHKTGDLTYIVKCRDISPSLRRSGGAEYSYWSPTYDEIRPWWPHWLDRLGVIRLAEIEDSDSTQGFEFVERFALTTIEVEGNREIPTSELLEKLPFQPGDIISTDELSWLNRELEALDWFSDVRIETSPDSSGSSSTTGHAVEEEVEKPSGVSVKEEPNSPDSVVPQVEDFGDEPPPIPSFKVNLRIHMTEAPMGVVERLDLHRNRYFISPFLRAAFGLKQGRTSIEKLYTKCQLIENLYRHHGYDLVQITYQFSGTHLLIDIDEGHLDDIRFSGNRRIKLTELTDALGFKQGDAYSKQIGTIRLNQMRAKLNKNNLYFKSIKSWGVKREGDRNVLAIEVEERSRLKVNWLPFLDFNRVHGLILGGGVGVSTREANAQIHGEVSHGLSSEIWNYQLGTEKTWFDRHPLTVGGSVYQQTDANRYARWSQGGEFLGAFFLGVRLLGLLSAQGVSGSSKG